ncbi:hypothetical protein P872_09265 [Rhodonellum psychrophilum GCM71 = DSM 17998]|uniref:AMP-dependent synthetase/ligase domain-containing protein n=2 Tax=Rhodonellum TaxID=336827 RepID=U5BVF1_9BACT|nr:MULTISPECIES: phenylacetate--CoA ligase family protein [Rhodonellum]ERM81534.1 hypothetical protein P872_09265 [Rhodonellum psychrophilum GCM71 = DSM 17998]SDZ40601.1 Phenylacetate-coenzyme A ligase PaaK, adenylate-forming domain family [Rhodonellum ikkaensis]
MIERFYKHMPLFAQNCAISLKGLEFELFRINKKTTLNYYNFLKISEKWSLDQIYSFQLNSLNKVLTDAYKYVPYYRKLKINGIYIECLKNLDDLCHLPILEKSKVKLSPYDFLDERFKNKIRVGFTSGSTGSPMMYFNTTEIFSKRWAFELRLRDWAGLKEIYHPKRAHFTGKNIFDKKNFYRYNTTQNTLHLSSDFISEETAIQYAEILCDFNPEFIDSYPSCLQVLASICLLKNIQLPCPTAIRVSGENLEESKRILIEKAFNTKVYNQYGSRETTAFFSTNSFGDFVIHPEFSLIEFSDSFNQNGLEKEIISSPLFENNCMPLLRYRTGDLCLSNNNEINSSDQNNKFKVINDLSGRIEDTIFVEGIGYIQRLSTCFYGINSIIEGQLILVKQNEMLANIVVNSGFDSSDLEHLKFNLETKLSNLVNVKVVVVDYIPRGSNGKFKFLVNTLKNHV